MSEKSVSNVMRGLEIFSRYCDPNKSFLSTGDNEEIFFNYDPLIEQWDIDKLHELGWSYMRGQWWIE